MRHADKALDDALLLLIQQELAKRCKKSKTRGRKATPAEVVLSMLLLKHVRDWSYAELRNAVAGSARQSGLSRVHPDRSEKVPDDRTMGNLARQMGPGADRKLHRRVVEIAQENQIATGRKMRMDTTVVETDIHYPTDSTLLGDGVRVLTRIIKKVTAVAGKAGTLMRDRSRSAKLKVLAIARASRNRERPAENEERLPPTVGNHQPGAPASQEVFARDRRRRQARQAVRTAQSPEATR